MSAEMTATVDETVGESAAQSGPEGKPVEHIIQGVVGGSSRVVTHTKGSMSRTSPRGWWAAAVGW